MQKLRPMPLRAFVLSFGASFLVGSSGLSAAPLHMVKVAEADWARASTVLSGYEVAVDEAVLAVADDAERARLESGGVAVQVLDSNDDPALRWYVVDLQGRGLHSRSLRHLAPAEPGQLPAGFGPAVFQDRDRAVLRLDEARAHELHESGYELFEARTSGAPAAAYSTRRQETLGFWAADPLEVADPAPVLAALEPARRKLDHEYLVNLGTRHYAQEGGRLAAQFMKQRLQDAGLAAEFHDFVYRGVNLQNVVATLPGEDPAAPAVIISAHMDSIRLWGGTDKAPGADDNASGSSALLSVARAMARFKFERSVRFLAFHAEEVGLIGSKAYADMVAARGDQLAGVLNMDMLGYGGGKMEVIGDGPSTELVNRIKAVGQPVTSLEVIPTVKPEFWYSDHSSFWRKGYAAVLISEELDNFNPHIHTLKDTFDKISAERIDQSLRVTVAAASALAGLVGPR